MTAVEVQRDFHANIFLNLGHNMALGLAMREFFTPSPPCPFFLLEDYVMKSKLENVREKIYITVVDRFDMNII